MNLDLDLRTGCEMRDAKTENGQINYKRPDSAETSKRRMLVPVRGSELQSHR